MSECFKFTVNFLVLKITYYELYNRSFVVVKDFAVLEIFDAVLGSPAFLTKQDYETIKAVSKLKPNQVHPQTPSSQQSAL